MSEEKRETKKVYKLQVRWHPDRKKVVVAQWRKLHPKVTFWGGGKRSQLFETPHFSFLPSLAASCVAVFLFFEISKLEKHKFPKFFC
jgi:hypothetical protein